MFCSAVNTVISRRPEKCPAQRCRGHEAGRGLPVNLAKGFGGTDTVNYIPTSCGRKVFARLSKKIRKAAARSMVTGCTGRQRDCRISQGAWTPAGFVTEGMRRFVRPAGGLLVVIAERSAARLTRCARAQTWQRRNRTSRVGVSAFRPLVNDSA